MSSTARQAMLTAVAPAESAAPAEMVDPIDVLSATYTEHRLGIAKVIRKNETKIIGCYKRQLPKNRNLQGTVRTKIFALPTGAVTKVEASGMDKDVADCIAHVLERITLPANPSGEHLEINYPFNFKVSEGNEN